MTATGVQHVPGWSPETEDEDPQGTQFLVDRLDELGGDADTIAYRLSTQGILGDRDDAYCCPIAEYVRRAMVAWLGAAGTSGLDLDVEVDRSTVTVQYRPWGRAGSVTIRAVSEAVGDFTDKFDQGGYPSLVRASRAVPHA